MDRYQVDTDEGLYQPGSNNLVLKNLLGITSPTEIYSVETELLTLLYEEVFEHGFRKLDTKTILRWHYQWLGNLYSWAGKIRTVTMSKPNITFAACSQIDRALLQFESTYLCQFPSLSDFTEEQVFSFLAQSHVEFILIHPFREGNGRISRLLLDVMAVQAGYHPLDYSLWDENKDFYYKAIQAGIGDDYQYMERLVRDVLSA